MIYSFEYDKDYHPAMPLIEVNVKPVGSKDGLALTALVDSGADATMIPEAHLKQLGVSRSGWANMRGVAGISYRVPVYIVSLSIGQMRIGAIRVAGDRQNTQMILGRDVLNQFVVTLNGLAFTVEVSE